jgi:hypothetical protein
VLGGADTSSSTRAQPPGSSCSNSGPGREAVAELRARFMLAGEEDRWLIA